ncbi:MAG: hypothetical protein IJ539_01720 [Prevotella sp.]|nr:hypothetical protein [Prevotella sp.]
MKKLLLLTVFFTSQMMYAQNGYSVYEEDGLWGIRFNGETCLLPRFESISNIDEGGRFIYKEKGKWGIANVWRKVTEPFCDSLICLNTRNVRFPEIYSSTKSWDIFFQSYYLFSQMGKWGICLANGKEIFSPVYDEIYEKVLTTEDLGLDVTKTMQRYNTFFIVKENGVCKLIDRYGSVLASDIISYNYLFSKQGKKILNNLRKFIKKTEIGENAYSTWKSDVYEATVPYILYRKHISEDSEERKIYFGFVNDSFVPMQGDTMTICGMKSIVNDYGFISTPLAYDSPYFRLQRNPMDIYALLSLVDDNSAQLHCSRSYISESEVTSGVAEQDLLLLQNKIKTLSEILEMANNLGDSKAYDEVKIVMDRTQKTYDRYEENYNRTVKLMKFNAKIDRISSASTSFLNSMISALGGNSSNSTSTYSSNSNTSSSGITSKNSNSSTMSMSDQLNYNSLRNTYNKWASDLMQMKNANGKYLNGYTAADKSHAQSEMKRIRKEAKEKWGKDIPYNSYEDWK